MKNVDTRFDRSLFAGLSEIQRAAGNAGMAYLSGGNVMASLRLIRAELDRIEAQCRETRKPRPQWRREALNDARAF